MYANGIGLKIDCPSDLINLWSWQAMALSQRVMKWFGDETFLVRALLVEDFGHVNWKVCICTYKGVISYEDILLGNLF